MSLYEVVLMNSFHIEPYLDLSPRSVQALGQDKRLVSPRKESQMNVNTISSININELNEEDIENIDISSLVDINGTSTGTKIDNLPLDDVKDIEFSLDELDSVDLNDICALCCQDKPNEVDQLVKCSHCEKKYHTACLKLPPIPYRSIVPLEKRRRATYMKEHFKNWLCPDCMKNRPLSPKLLPASSSLTHSDSLLVHPDSPISPIPHPAISSPGLKPLSEPFFKFNTPHESTHPTPIDSPVVSAPVSPIGSPVVSPPGSPRPVRPVLKKVMGTDLSRGGVIVGTKEYMDLQDVLHHIQVPKTPAMPIPQLATDIVPIYTDSEPSSEDELVKSDDKRHVKPAKLKSFLQSLLVLPGDQSDYDAYISNVMKLVKQNRHSKDLDVVYAVPVFLLRSMLQTAALSPSTVPMRGITKIDGKEVVRIADHPKLKEYFDRLLKGEKIDDIKKDLVAAGLDESLIEKNPNTVVSVDDYKIVFSYSESGPLPSTKSTMANSIIRLRAADHPIFRKYFNMLKRNVQKEEVVKSMESIGLDPSILDNPDKLIEYVPPPPLPSPISASMKEEPSQEKKGESSQEKKEESIPKKVKLCDHPMYSRYFTMLKRGLPKQSVIHAMNRDKIDPSILDKDPNEEIEIEEKKEEPSQEEKGESSQEKKEESIPKKVKLCEHPMYSKYFTMLKRGLPKQSVIHAMNRDKIDPSILDKDPNEEIEIEEEKKEEPISKKVKLCDHPMYAKYFTMLKRGLPKQSVIHAMNRDKIDPSILDKDPNEEIEIEEKKDEKKEESPQNYEIVVTPRIHKVPLKDSPDYKSYFTMLQHEIPPVQIKRFMRKDGKDPSIIDRDPDSLVEVEVFFISLLEYRNCLHLCMIILYMRSILLC